MKQIPPLLLRQKYWRYIDQEIKRIFDALIFTPLADAMRIHPTQFTNAQTGALYKAISDGVVWFENGRFFGEWSAALTRELRALGATYNRKSKTWSLGVAPFPMELSVAQANADGRYDALRKAFIRTLDDVNIKSVDKISTSDARYRQTITWMEEDFQKSVSAITVPPNLTPAQNKLIAKEWGQNLDLYIKKWIGEDILQLRQEVQANAFAGHRAKDLVQMVQDNYGVSRRKAEFLARQETSLLVSKFRETRYRDIGSTQYRWSTSHDERVRHDHKDLNNLIFDWTLPPITNRRTGARNHPGQDFGCRCVAIALID